MKTYSFLLGKCLLLGAVLLSTACKKDPDEPTGPLGPIELDCGHFSSDQTLVDDPDRAVDYLITCVMDVDADIVVNPGVVVEFAEDAGINVRETGSFRANGNTSAPIRFTGSTKSKGSWKGLLFNSSSSNNRLSYTTIDYAGGTAFNTNNDMAAVIVWADAQLDLQNCTISNSGNYGLSAIYTNSDWRISNSTITTANNAPVTFLGPYLTAFDGSNSFTGNANDYLLLQIETEEITSSLTWKKSSVPYRITSTFNFFTELNIDNAAVTIEPGVTINFESGTGLQVDDNASLIAIGTATERITFAGVVQNAGSWSAIYFDDNGTTDSELKYVDIRHAGATLDGSNGGILMRSNPVLKLDEVNFSDIDACSVYNKDVMLNPNLTHSNLNHTNTQGTLCSD